MTEPLFFDTDCISAFLWVKEQSILVKMFPGRIGIPRQTYEELSIPEIPHLKSRVDQLIEGGQAQIVDINFDTETSLDKGTQRKTTENELPSLTQCTA